MKRLEYFVVLAAIGLSILVSLADLSGALSGIPWLATRIPAMTLLVLSIVMGYLVVERGNKLDSIEHLILKGSQETSATQETGIRRIITSLKGADVTLFESRRDFFEHAERKIHKWKTIDVTHFGLSAPSKDDADSAAYYETFARVIKEKQVRVRRILIIRDQQHVEWARVMLNDFADCPRFFLSAYLCVNNYIPMINLMIVDGSDVYIGGGERAPRDDAKAMLVKHPDFATGLEEHFKTLLDQSTELRSVSDLEQLIARMEPVADQPQQVK